MAHLATAAVPFRASWFQTSGLRSRTPIVPMMQPAGSRQRHDLSFLARSPLHRTTFWAVAVQCRVTAVVIVIGDVLLDETAEVLLVHNDHVVEQLSP